jgi:glutamyl-tRNA reductase
MKDFGIIAFTHKNTSLDQVGQFHIAPDQRKDVLENLRNTMQIKELMYLSTCNRVEFLVVSDFLHESDFLFRFFNCLLAEKKTTIQHDAAQRALFFRGDQAVHHFFSVASSLDSLVVGEREIITQVRTAFEESVAMELSGDFIRLLLKSTIETAKRVFTDTSVSRNPVSVVSLAHRTLKGLNVPKNARILVIGTGQTNTNLCKYLKKQGYHKFVLFNRSVKNAETLAASLNGSAFALDALPHYTSGFDVLIACTAAANHIIDPELYGRLLQGDTSSKIVVDLAIPADVDPAVYRQFSVTPILVESLKQAAEENLALRRNALQQCEAILAEQMQEFRNLYRQRQVELAMKEVPRMVREIREHATTTVFARELSSLDDSGREVLEKMLTYLEKKYISMPMKMAREILLDSREA